MAVAKTLYTVLISVVTIVWTLYLEYGQGLGALVTSSGGRNFFNILNVVNVVKLMFRPLWDLRMWNYRYLDINWIFVISVATLLWSGIMYFVGSHQRITIMDPDAGFFDRLTSYF